MVRPAAIQTQELTCAYGQVQALKALNLEILQNEIFGIIGPANSGKTTFLRALNRLNNLNASYRQTGDILLAGRSIRSLEDSELRRKVGIIFALPQVLPISIFENIVYGPRVHGVKDRARLEQIVETSLKKAHLWDEVKDRLHSPAARLSGGQQQRLCMARTLAVEPEVILYDEPCSGLDPISTAKVEDTMRLLKDTYTQILVTNNTKQAARVSDRCGFFLMGEVVEVSDTATMFANPKEKRTDDYISGRFDYMDDAAAKIETIHLNLYYGDFQALKDVCLKVPGRNVTALIGPSGCGKSTLLRSLNRMNDLIENCRMTGQILVEGRDILDPEADLIALRRTVGMVFQRPNVFDLSIYGNLKFGLRIHGMLRKKADVLEAIRSGLEQVGLWDDLKDRLHKNARSLTLEQQQRLCIARVLILKPDIVLLDEPCSALDPIATLRIEELLRVLKRDYTLVIVTHNMQQAARASDYTGFMYLGQLVEFGLTPRLFTNPREKLTENYISGHFG